MSELDFKELFLNEAFVKANQALRLVEKTENAKFRPYVLSVKSDSLILNLLYAGIYRLLSLIALLKLIISPKQVCTDQEIFILHDPRLLSFNKNKCQEYYVGIHKIFRIKGRHLYSSLTINEILMSIKLSIRNRYKIQKELKSVKLPYNLSKICDIGIFRILDVYLCYFSILKFQRVYFAGHFDFYVSLISQLRKSGSIMYAEGFQHGLFEIFKIGKPIPIYVDRYTLLYKQSKPYFMENFLENPDCEVLIANKSFNPVQRLKQNRTVIAVALQNDSYERDEELLMIIEKCCTSRNCMLVGYLHPQTRPSRVSRLNSTFGKFSFETKVRHADIDLVITRYSTLAMDYAATNIPAIFFVRDDSVCITHTFDQSIMVAHSVNELNDFILKKIENDM